MNDLFFLYFQHAINLQLSSLSFVIRKKINWIYCFLFSFLRSTSGYLPLDLVISSLLSSLKIKNNVVYFLTSGEGNGTPLQYSCLENPMDVGAWQAAVHGVTRSWTQLSDFTFTHWRRKWQPTPVFLPGESQGPGSLVGCRLWGRTESDTTEVTQQQQQQQSRLWFFQQSCMDVRIGP